MIIEDDTLNKIAQLANIKIEDSEREMLKHDMTAILAWVDKLSEIDTSKVEPITHMTSEKNRVRKDVDKQNIPVEKALQNAKLKSDNYFVVPKVINKNNE
jgi:aspartyl-tRNA(Asn)/glutamyl-tRNA(Gln) amidotransferase subunit C